MYSKWLWIEKVVIASSQFVKDIYVYVGTSLLSRRYTPALIYVG